MGLRDQLLKAGLVSKKQAQKVNADVRRNQHVAHKNADVARELAQQSQAELQSLEQEQARKREDDRRRNLEMEAARLEKEKRYRVRQLIQSNNQSEINAEERYFFRISDTKIISIFVTAFQREMIARGKIGIVECDDGDDKNFAIVPSQIIVTIQQLIPTRYTLLHSSVEDWQDVGEIVEKEYWQDSEILVS